MSEENSTSDTPTEGMEDAKPIETPQVHTVFNKSTHDEGDSYQDKPVTEFEQTKENGEQNIGKENKLLSTNFAVKIGNQKVERLTTYSLDQQMFKFWVNSGKDQELWGLNVDLHHMNRNG